MQVTCPPLDVLLAAVDNAVNRAACRLRPVLQHGDLHLGNVMVRRAGNGFAVRLIDPNPEIGHTDPLYDLGKLFHFAEPVGWAQVAPEYCTSTWRCREDAWALDATHDGVDDAVERRRRAFVRLLNSRVGRLLDGENGGEERLPIAIASAHIGLAALKTKPSDTAVRRFAFAHALRHLAVWFRAAHHDR
jgi:hypothetical protein